MRALVTHAMVAAQNKKRSLTVQLVLFTEVLEQSSHNIVHLIQLGRNEWTAWTCKVSDVIEAQIVQNHDVP